MKCPNCDREMINHSKHVLPLGFSGVTTDHDIKEWVESYECKQCDIKKQDEKWIVPDHLLPSTKQFNTVKFIESRLGHKGKPVTKRAAWKIINKYFETAKNISLYQDTQPEDKYFGDEPF